MHDSNNFPIVYQSDRGAIPKKPGTGGTDAAARSSQKNVSNGRGPKADTAASASSPNSQMLNKPDEPEEEDCCICMCPVTNPKTLKCKHTFCTECIDRGFKIKPACPVCGTIYGKITGNQPKNGSMNHTKSSSTKLPGYESCGAIIISYSFPSGTQTVSVNLLFLIYFYQNSNHIKLLFLISK